MSLLFVSNELQLPYRQDIDMLKRFWADSTVNIDTVLFWVARDFTLCVFYQEFQYFTREMIMFVFRLSLTSIMPEESPY